MGCCVSSGKSKDNVSDENTTIVEEETVVKEVLSETKFLSTEEPVKMKIRETEVKRDKTATVHDPGMTRPDLTDPEEGSEVSEICSLSLSESVSSTVVMNGFDEEEVMMKQRKSPAKTRTRVTGNNYPTRRTDQSPRKRNVGVGSGMKDPAERSGRRSRSPAINRSVMDSNQSQVGGVRTRKNSQSPGRVRMDPQRYVNESPGRVRLDPNKTVSDQQRYQNNHDYTTEELLENPLVSLECFIFL